MLQDTIQRIVIYANHAYSSHCTFKVLGSGQKEL